MIALFTSEHLVFSLVNREIIMWIVKESIFNDEQVIVLSNFWSYAYLNNLHYFATKLKPRNF